jgi:hypothetical protein
VNEVVGGEQAFVDLLKQVPESERAEVVAEIAAIAAGKAPVSVAETARNG